MFSLVQEEVGNCNFATLIGEQCQFWYSWDSFGTCQVQYIVRWIQCRIRYIVFRCSVYEKLCKMCLYINLRCMYCASYVHVVVFTALQYAGGLSYGKGVCPSVCLSVRHTREL